MNAFLLLILLVFSQSVFAYDESQQQKTHFNYMMSCQGCHGPTGLGGEAVPVIKNNIGLFLTSQKGREYLVRVPGSATSVLTDSDLADVLNWMIEEFAGDSKPKSYQPYTSSEVKKLRQQPLTELVQYRRQLINELKSN